MKTIILSIISALIVVSCNNHEDDDNNENDDHIASKKEFYQRIMKEKNFRLEINGPCDDAFEDTLHKESVAYIDSKTITDKGLVVEFKFIEACCQEFSGDYSIQNDTLYFNFEQVNDEVCSCLCWYRYKLTIKESGRKFQDIKIEKKDSK